MSPPRRALTLAVRENLPPRGHLQLAEPAGRMRSGLSKQRGALYRQLLDTPAAERKPKSPAPAAEGLSGHSQSFGRVLTIIDSDCALLERDGKLALLALPVAERWLRQAQLTPGAEAVCAQPLLIPLRIKVSEEEKTRSSRRSRRWQRSGLNSSPMRTT